MLLRFFLSVFVVSGTVLSLKGMEEITLQSRIQGSLFGAAIGDGLGGFTEFNKWRMSYTAQLLGSYADLTSQEKNNQSLLQGQYKGQEIIPYTDDTAMAIVVMCVLLQARKHNWDDNRIACQLAEALVFDMNHNSLGWNASARAPGNACKTGVTKLATALQNKQNTDQNWWRMGGQKAGGCGSVMRAHPYGLVFADDIARAERLAVEHSRFTHQDPSALAACAAMAVGTALAVQGKDVDQIVAQMISVAAKYEKATAEHIHYAYGLALLRQERVKKFGAVYTALKDKNFRAFHNQTFPKNDVHGTKKLNYAGWSARSAIAAAVYILTLSPDDVDAAICLGVHTLGDSDSIASMAGALVGARCGIAKLNKQNVAHIEGSKGLQVLANECVTSLPQILPITPDVLPIAPISDLKDELDTPWISLTTLSSLKWPLVCAAVAACAYYIYEQYINVAEADDEDEHDETEVVD